MTVTVERGVIYAEIPGYRALELDVYRDPSVEESRPLLINVHGGGWRVSNRQRAPRETRGWERSFHERMVDTGFVVACPSYRYSAEALYPAAVDDVTTAVAFLRANANQFGADPTQVVLFGQSAGGYLALAVGLACGADRSVAPVQGIIAWYPLTDFSTLSDDDSAAIFPSQWLGAPLSAIAETVERARLPRLARSDSPPVLLQHGTADTMAPYDQSVRMEAALRTAGASVELETIDGAGHFFAGATDETVERIFTTAMTFGRTCTTKPS